VKLDLGGIQLPLDAVTQTFGILAVRGAGKSNLAGGTEAFATDPGLAMLGDFEQLPTGDDLREYWLNRLPEGESKLLAAVAEAFPKPIERERLSEMTGYARSSRDTYLQRLNARKLVKSVGRGEVVAVEALFG
jgi:hypothetical protein